MFFLVNAANEQRTDLVKLTITAPQNLPLGVTTKAPTGWTADKSDTAITFSGPGIKPDNWDQWGFEIDSADQPGTYTYKITLSFADGSKDDVSVPVHAVVSTAAAGAKSTSGNGNKANVALGMGGGAVVLSLIALALSARRKSGAAAPAGAKQDF